MGTGAVQALARLYLFPDGAHCGGGEGPFDFDVLTAPARLVSKTIAS
jgi:feruloyl esterase